MYFLQEKKDFNDFKGKILVEGAETKDKKYFIEGIFMQGDIKNQNGRIYPFDVLKKASATYIKEKVLTNRAIGELNHPCLPPDANVFVVNRGLIPITDVQVGDVVYGNDENGNTIESEVLETMSYPFNGELIEFNSRAFRTKTTPNHRFYINDRKGKQQIMTAETIKHLVSENKLRHYTIPISMNWDLQDDEEFIFPKVVRKTVSPYTEEDLSIDMNLFCALAGIYLSEGHIQYVLPKHKKYKLPAAVCISQNVGKNLNEIEDLLNIIGLNYRKDIETSSANPKARLYIKDTRIAEYFSQFGNCYNKFVPDVILESSKENIETFLYWFNLGDVSTVTHDGYTRSDVFTTSPKLANGLIECILKIGCSTNKRIQVSKQDYIFADRLIEVKNKQPLFRMTIGKNKVKYLDSKCLIINNIPYQGNVYCLRTETGNFWVEHYGSSHLTGNSHDELDFERAAIKIEGLKPDGSNMVGRAKVLTEMPMGKIVKGLIVEGILFGVSSRARGSLTETNQGNIVGDDLYLITAADIVSDPSAPDAYCTAIMEGKEWVWEAGKLHTVERQVKHQINEIARTGLNDQKLLEIFNKTLNMMKFGEV